MLPGGDLCAGLGLLEVDTLIEAVDIINAKPYGNVAVIFTQSGSAASAFQKSVEAGQVGVNMPIPRPPSHVFVYWQQSKRLGYGSCQLLRR